MQNLRLRAVWRALIVLTATVVPLLIKPASLRAGENDNGEASLGDQLPIAAMLPFVGLLLCIALLPLLAGHWWERNRNKAIVAAALSVPLAIYLAAAFGEAGIHE